MPAPPTTLQDLETAIWRELVAAAADRDHEWRTPVLATAGLDERGEPSADARTVVLRQVDADQRRLLIYTDVRARKVAQLRACANATLVMWSRRLGWQLRCRLRCDVAEDGLAVSSHWARIRLSSAAHDYLSPLAPGSAIAAVPPPVADRSYFALLDAAVVAIDWLELGPAGHRRASFERGQADWLQP